MMLEISGKHQDKSDEELLLLYRRTGQLEQLGELYSRYMPLVYGVSLKYLQDREEAMDSVMQIFEKLVAELPRHQVKSFKSWLYVITKNHCLMTLRAKKTDSKRKEEIKRAQDFMESDDEMHPLDRDDPVPEKALKECIGELKEEQRKCIELFYFQEHCYKEISEQLRMEEKKVKSHLQNGKRNLKICLERKNVNQEET
jgi:RNA polymerase sigma-70 factor (ECF subfamily)